MPSSESNHRPVALTIAGSDSSGGAGIQIDLRAFWDHGCLGTCALTCITAQNLDGVHRVDALPPEAVVEQIKAVSSGFEVRAVKTGMLYSRGIIEAVAAAVDEFLSGVPLVIDPVMVATSGARLLQQDAISAYQGLFERATVVTPNLDELAVLIGERPANADDLETAARKLAEQHGCSVLAKGGHLIGEPIDVLVTESSAHRFGGIRRTEVNTHGSGCALASSMAAGLARGLDLPDAAGEAKAWLNHSLENPVPVRTATGEVLLMGGFRTQLQNERSHGRA